MRDAVLWANILGSIGVSMLLGAFILNVAGILRISYIFTLLNLVGAALAAIASVLLEFVPFVILETVWCSAAAVKLVALLRRDRTVSPQASSQSSTG